MTKRRRMLNIIETFLIIFLTMDFSITCVFMVFFWNTDVPMDDVKTAAIYAFFNVLFIALVFTVIGIVGKHFAIDRPIKQIESALDRVKKGDFSVRMDTRRAQAEFAQIMEDINDMTEELSGVETLRTDFMANVSHEMKTPLAVMQNYGVLLQEPNLSEEKRIEYAKAISENSRKLADMMTNILKLNRLENQQIYPKANEYNLGEQLCECLLQYESTWEKKDISIETDIEDDVNVVADAELLSLVWNNLFSNAFKFTESGGTVYLTLKVEEEYAVVKVRDTGCGMSPEIGTHIFEKFYQGDTSHATQGNGLGLALVKRVVAIMQGEIGVSSVQGQGSTFTVKIRRLI